MLRGDWGARFSVIDLIVFFSLVFLPPLWVYASQPSKNQKTYEHSQQADKDNNQQGLGPVSPAYVSTQDTLAQWVMAIAAIVATGISGWAVYLLYETLKQTSRSVEAANLAVKEAREGTKAAFEMNELTRIAQRPWLCIDKELRCHFNHRSVSDNPNSTHQAFLAYSFRIRNRGKSVAVGYGNMNKIVVATDIADAHTQFKNFVKETTRGFRSGPENTIFPNEHIEFDRNWIACSVKHRDPEAHRYFFFMIVNYASADRKTEGHEARIFRISVDDAFIGPMNAKLLEISMHRRTG